MWNNSLQPSPLPFGERVRVRGVGRRRGLYAVHPHAQLRRHATSPHGRSRPVDSGTLHADNRPSRSISGGISGASAGGIGIATALRRAPRRSPGPRAQARAVHGGRDRAASEMKRLVGMACEGERGQTRRAHVDAQLLGKLADQRNSGVSPASACRRGIPTFRPSTAPAAAGDQHAASGSTSAEAATSRIGRLMRAHYPTPRRLSSRK